MANNLEINIRENVGATAEKAPYLGNVVVKRELLVSDAVAHVVRLTGMPRARVESILMGIFREIAKIETEDMLTRFNLDGFSVFASITGKVFSVDAPFDPNRNSLNLCIGLAEAVKMCVANETPNIVTPETSRKVRVDHVVDTVAPRPYEVVYGQRPFFVHGMNLVLSDANAKAWFVDDNCLEHDLVVDADDRNSRQCIKVHLATVPSDGCDGKVFVRSRGGDADGLLQTSFRRVKFIKNNELAIDRLHSDAEGCPEGKVAPDETFSIFGTGFDQIEDSDKVRWETTDGELINEWTRAELIDLGVTFSNTEIAVGDSICGELHLDDLDQFVTVIKNARKTADVWHGV